MDKILTDSEQAHLREDYEDRREVDRRKGGRDRRVESLDDTIILRGKHDSLVENVNAMRDAIDAIERLQGKLAIIRTAWSECREAPLSKGLQLAVMIIDQALET